MPFQEGLQTVWILQNRHGERHILFLYHFPDLPDRWWEIAYWRGRAGDVIGCGSDIPVPHPGIYLVAFEKELDAWKRVADIFKSEFGMTDGRDFMCLHGHHRRHSYTLPEWVPLPGGPRAVSLNDDGAMIAP